MRPCSGTHHKVMYPATLGPMIAQEYTLIRRKVATRICCRHRGGETCLRTGTGHDRSLEIIASQDLKACYPRRHQGSAGEVECDVPTPFHAAPRRLVPDECLDKTGDQDDVLVSDVYAVSQLCELVPIIDVLRHILADEVVAFEHRSVPRMFQV